MRALRRTARGQLRVKQCLCGYDKRHGKPRPHRFLFVNRRSSSIMAAIVRDQSSAFEIRRAAPE
jgi:hypothetical protein